MSYATAVESLYALGHELAANSEPHIGGAPVVRRKWELAHMRTLCSALGDPQLKFPSILVAGTNGKGSTSATLASILATSGYRTALYTSPHLVRVNERIQLSRAEAAQNTLSPISDDDFARLYFKVDDTANALLQSGALPHPPSFFEVMTAIAFLYFAESRAEIAILEVGLGGRLDATNIVEPMLSIITDISLDHTEWLGHTITEIAREKSGILRRNGVLVTLPQHPEANQAIGEAAVALDVRGVNAAQYIPSRDALYPVPATNADAQRLASESLPDNSGSPQSQNTVILNEVKDPCIAPLSVLASAQTTLAHRSFSTGSDPLTQQTILNPLLSRNRYTLTVLGEEIEIDSPLAGQHQQRNLALAIAAAVELCNSRSVNIGGISNSISYNITAAAISKGIRNTQWPGRLEIIPVTDGGNSRFVLLDAAHNPAGAWTLRAALSQLPEGLSRTLLFSCLRDKPIAEVAQILFPVFDGPSDRILLTQLDNPRAASIQQMLAAIGPLAEDINPLESAHDVAASLAHALAITPPGGLVVATGSIYLIGNVRGILLPGRDKAPTS